MNCSKSRITNVKTSIFFFLILLFFSNPIDAQNSFTAGATLFTDQDNVKTVDIDQDGDQDIISISDSGIEIHLNDGSGNFTKADNATIGLPVVDNVTLGWSLPNFGVGHVIGNSAPDIIIAVQEVTFFMGIPIGFNNATKLYTNDGSGNFTLETGTPFNTPNDAVIGIADLDNNGHNDIIIAGTAPNSVDDFGFFWNDGAGNFTVGPELISNRIKDGDIQFGDIDNDADLDFILGGGLEGSVIIFRNNGDMTFSVVASFSAGEIFRASFFDADQDNDLDLVYGNSNNGDFLYINDGAGNFTLDPNFTTDPTVNFSIATGDIDGDGDQDIFLEGLFNSVTSGGFYINDGSGRFYLDTMITIPNGHAAHSVLTDVTGDGNLDLINSRVSNLYVNAFPGFGNTVDFDGVNTYTIPHLAAVNTLPVTFEFWTKTTDGTVGVYDKRDGNGANYIEIRILVGRYGFNYSSSSGGGMELFSDPTNLINDGNWHHCAVTLTTTEGKMYVDGVLDQTASWTGTAGPITNTLDVTLGDFSGNLYTGDLDEFRIWNTERTNNEIIQNMCSKISNPAANTDLIAYYTFDQYVNGNRFFDNSSNYNHATISANSITVGTEQTNCTAPSLLPVDLIYFQGRAIEQGNLLTWQTASELNNKGFEIERSHDGNDWEVIHFERGNGSIEQVSNYTYLDDRSLAGINYYRLRQVDFDGQFEYSSIVSIENIDKQIRLRIFPNPVTDFLIVENNTFTSVQILNQIGQIVLEVSLNESNRIDISELPNGIYWVKIDQQYHKIIIQH